MFGNEGRQLAAVFGDCDDDGDPDLFIANDRQPNFLFLNSGDGTFVEHGIIAGVAYNEEGYAESAMGADFGDYDNDGRLDIILATFQGLPNTLYHNDGGGFFSDLTFAAHLGAPSVPYLGMAAVFFDCDNVHRLRREYELEAHDEGLKALTAPDGEEQVLFSWRGGQMTTAAYWSNLAASHTRLDSAARYKAAENLAGVQIMMAEGRKLQYDHDPKVREPVEQKRDALIVEWLYRTEGREVARQQPITEEDIRAYYDANVEMFTRTDGKVADLSLVYNSIKTLLRQQAATRSMDAFIAGLREQYSEDIEINTEVLAEVSLQVLAQLGEDADKGE